MKTKQLLIFINFFLFGLGIISLPAQTKDSIPLDPTVKYGKLENGLTYYIKKNSRPEQRMELRLVVKTGSVTEDDDQKGLAHFCEHMAFNGTKNFPKQELVSFLESTGVDFGADLNAFTSYDETVYMLKIATDKPELIEKGLQVLEDWAHNVSYDDVEIDKERGVIHEEWRLGKGAEDRIWRKQEPVMFYKSRYAERDVIGDTAVFLRAKHDAYRRYYHDWYRPDLMAVIVIGDIDETAILNKVKQHFSGLTVPANARKREKYTLPDNKEVLISVESDKELAYPSVSIMFKYPERNNNTEASLHLSYVEDIIGTMLDNRYSELSRLANPPFEWAYCYAGEFFGDKRTFDLSSSVKGADAKAAYEALLTEAYRASQNGFTKGELERAKASILSDQKKTYNEKEKTESGNLIWKYVSNFLTNQPAAGFEYDYQHGLKEIPALSLDEVNAYLKKMITKENVIILVSTPEKEGFVKPKKEDILKFFNDISSKKLEAYKDDVTDKPFFSEKVTPGKITKQSDIKEIGVKDITLSNGARIILKPTDFKNDDIRFSAFSYGGTATIKDNDYYAVINAANIVGESGIGEYSPVQLDKYLSGKILWLNPYISNYSEGFSGNTAPKDLETFMQMIHLYFTQPRKDSEAFASFKNKEIAYVTNDKNMPEETFYDTITSVIYKHHFRKLPESVALTEKMDLEKSYAFYKERFNDAGDFTFVFVGSFKEETIIPLLEKYIGSLPTTNKKEVLLDDGVRLLKGSINKKVYKGIDPKSSVGIRITGEMTYTPEERYMIKSLMDILDIRLREVIREDLSGTYGIYAYSNQNKWPVNTYTVAIGWGCNPDRVDELTKAVNGVLNDIKIKGIDASYVEKVKEIQKRKMETDLKENNFWLRQLQTTYFNNEDPSALASPSKFSDLLTSEKIKELANKYLNDDMLIFQMFPEQKK
jgi:zinc protease